MTKVNVRDAKTQLSRLLARLVAVAKPAADRVPGTWKGLIEMADDFDDEMQAEWKEPLEPSGTSEC